MPHPKTFDDHTRALLDPEIIEERKAVADRHITPAMREAFDLLLNHMTPQQRGYVLCWFCDVCRTYVPPGESCNHHEEEDDHAHDPEASEA